MTTQQPTGFQIAFFTFALLLLVVPLNAFLARYLPAGPEQALIARTLPLLIVAIAFLVIAQLRRACARDLSVPIPRDRASEVATMSVLIPMHGFAWAGIWVLWWHLREGPVALEQRVAQLGTHAEAMAAALTTPTLLFHFVLGAIVAPVIEELLFRGFLYRAWERQVGWIASMLLTSAVFASYHANFVPAFMASILWVCLYRRTGTLKATILSHMLVNMATHYALLGQFIFPHDMYAPGDLASWKLQMAFVLIFAVAIPTYVFMARDANARHAAHLDDHAPLPR